MGIVYWGYHICKIGGLLVRFDNTAIGRKWDRFQGHFAVDNLLSLQLYGINSCLLAVKNGG